MRPSVLDDVREVARGWRWTRRALTPRTAERWDAPPAPRDFPTEWARTAGGRAAREALQRFVLKPLVWNETRPRVEGLDRLHGLRPPVMFISNHSSHLDAPLVLCSLPKPWRERTATAAAADYFFDVWWRAASTALVFNAIPIERAGTNRSTSTAARLVREGWNLLVFPEGTRSRDGWLQRFRTGAARLCTEDGIPAVPIAIRGSFGAMPRGRGWPRKGRFPISVRYGEPVVPADGETAVAFSERLRQALARTWEEDSSTWWESLRREHRG
ncbi:MAG: lysophospholipid acyltransferase family protein, partial [Actinomycetota bacterium]